MESARSIATPSATSSNAARSGISSSIPRVPRASASPRCASRSSRSRSAVPVAPHTAPEFHAHLVAALPRVGYCVESHGPPGARDPLSPSSIHERHRAARRLHPSQRQAGLRHRDRLGLRQALCRLITARLARRGLDHEDSSHAGRRPHGRDLDRRPESERCTATDTCPKRFEVNSANEYWVKAGSLLHTDTHGNDLKDPEDVRYYLVSGSRCLLSGCSLGNTVVRHRLSVTLSLRAIAALT